jgi:hypothetical protein
MQTSIGTLIAFSFFVCASCAPANEDEDVTTGASPLALDSSIKGARTPIGSLDSKSLADRLARLKQTSRFIRMQAVLREDHLLSIDLSRAEGRVYPEGDFLSIPLISVKDGSDSGYAVIGRRKWGVTVVRSEVLPEGYLVQEDGKLTPVPAYVEVPADEEEGYVSRLSLGGGAQIQSSMSCQYVSYMGFSFACVSDGNIFGFYYKWTTRIGYGDLSMPQWWACVWGNTHVCPQYEYGYYSPVIVSLCGYAPHHWEGG